MLLQVAPPHVDRAAQSKNTLRIGNAQSLGAFRGGSLPDVSAPRPGVKTTSLTATGASKVTCAFTHSSVPSCAFCYNFFEFYLHVIIIGATRNRA